MILFTIQCYLCLNCKICFECDAMLFYSFFVTRNVYLYEEKHFVIHSAKIAILKYVNVESKKKMKQLPCSNDGLFRSSCVCRRTQLRMLPAQ